MVLSLNINIPLTETEEEERQRYNLIPTLNQMGYMYERHSPSVNEYLKAYTDSLSHIKDPVLDIGVAYGITVLDSIQKGAHVIANEIHQPHLDILAQNIPEALKSHVTFNLARFPEETEFEENSLGAVLSSRVFNFLTGREIDLGSEKVFKWLKPGGKFYIIAETVYKDLFKEIIPTFHERLAQDEEWPGEISCVRCHMTKRQEHLPDELHFLGEKVLKRSLEKAGFTIEKCSLFSKRNVPPDALYDGKETVGIIGVKPL